MSAVMNRAALLLLTLFLLPAAVRAQPKSPKQPLELTAEIVSQSYCAVNQNSAALELKLKLRYRNVGKQTLILYKGHDLFYQSKILSAPGNTSGPYAVWLVNSRYFDEEPELIDQASAGRVFLTLASGKAYVREMMIGVGIVDERVERGDSSIRAGDHTLQLVVATWYKSRALAQKLRQQWQPQGLLWSDPVASVPVHFMARKPRLLAPCKSSS